MKIVKNELITTIIAVPFCLRNRSGVVEKKFFLLYTLVILFLYQALTRQTRRSKHCPRTVRE